jgi:tyrosine-specific transport protein
MRYSILFGTLIALVIYIFCQWMIIGIVSTNDLQSAYQSGGPITQAVQILAKKTWVKSAINLFGISALITSLLGVSFSVIDFLEDGLKLKRKGKHRFVLCLLTLVPPFIITTSEILTSRK